MFNIGDKDVYLTMARPLSKKESKEKLSEPRQSKFFNRSANTHSEELFRLAMSLRSRSAILDFAEMVIFYNSIFCVLSFTISELRSRTISFQLISTDTSPTLLKQSLGIS